MKDANAIVDSDSDGPFVDKCSENAFAAVRIWIPAAKTFSGALDSVEFKNNMMNRTMRLAEQEVAQGGLPFATLIVNAQGDVVVEAVNRVAQTHDPTDHAEIRALRILTAQIKKNEIQDYEVYVIGHPCLMCYSALMLAKPKKIYFSVTLKEKNAVMQNVANGIDICAELGKRFSERTVPMEQLTHSRQKALDLFKSWNQRSGKKQ